MNLHKLIFVNNPCFIAGKTIIPRGIMVHSTGANNPTLKRYVGPDDGLLGTNRYNNHWNNVGTRRVCVHGFIGKLADGTVATYQTLPWNHRAWHCAGKGNDTHIAFEICEDGLKDPVYFNAVYKEATELCAYLAQMYGISVQNIIGHYEGHKLGIANNHGDPKNWFPKFGKSMDTFREEVRMLLGGSVPAAPIDVPDVNVTLTRQENADALGKKIGDTIRLPVEEYLLGVVPAEVSNAPIEAAKAQAIAARSFALKVTEGGVCIDDTTKYQAYRAERALNGKYPNAYEGVKQTLGQVLTHNREIIDKAWYSHSNGGQCFNSGDAWHSKDKEPHKYDRPFLMNRPDPWTEATGKPKKGHAVGLSQVGAEYAANNGVGYTEILGFYYPGTTITGAYGTQPKEEIMHDLTGHRARINTNKDAGLYLWSTRTKARDLINVRKGEIVSVIEDHNPDKADGWVTAIYQGVQGFADKQYLVDLGKLPPTSEQPRDSIAIDKQMLQAQLEELGEVAAGLNDTMERMKLWLGKN
jgi:N-acetylmuramoyl-L-alanine amidase